MSKLDVKVHMKLLKEAKEYLENVKPASEPTVADKKSGILLTEEHIFEWLQVFYDDRIMLDGCNHSKIKY